jgi:hypothetical protein
MKIVMVMVKMTMTGTQSQGDIVYKIRRHKERMDEKA